MDINFPLILLLLVSISGASALAGRIILAKKLKNGSALFGTIDTYLVYRLTNMESYSTDFTNASRTLFFDKL
jgi:glycerol kinase